MIRWILKYRYFRFFHKLKDEYQIYLLLQLFHNFQFKIILKLPTIQLCKYLDKIDNKVGIYIIFTFKLINEKIK